jgi:hypothetical protein
MTTRNKTFDCVEMKQKAQVRLQARWERDKHRFRSYEEFLEAVLQESDWGRKTLGRIRDRGDSNSQ